jgi:hypothetical protein
MTFSIKNWKNATLNLMQLLIMTECCYHHCRDQAYHSECHYSERHYAERRGGKMEPAALIFYFLLRTLVRAVMSDCAVKLSKTSRKMKKKNFILVQSSKRQRFSVLICLANF